MIYTHLKYILIVFCASISIIYIYLSQFYNYTFPIITMYKIIASLYRFNMRGSNRSIPYFATLTNLLALFTLCFFIIIALLNMQSVLKFWHTGSKGGDYLIGAVIVVPLYLLMFRMFPERKMKEQEALLTKKEYQLGLFSYVFLVIIISVPLKLGRVKY